MKEYRIDARVIDGTTRWELYKIKHADDICISLVGLILTFPISIPLVLYGLIFREETLTPFFYEYLYTVYTEEEVFRWGEGKDL